MGSKVTSKSTLRDSPRDIWKMSHGDVDVSLGRINKLIDNFGENCQRKLVEDIRRVIQDEQILSAKPTQAEIASFLVVLEFSLHDFDSGSIDLIKSKMALFMGNCNID